MTATQIARIAGFNASLEMRGIELSVAGSAVTFKALIEDASLMTLDGEVAPFDQKLSKIHVLNCPETSVVKHGTVFVDVSGGLKHTVCGSEPFDIKTVYRCVTETNP